MSTLLSTEHVVPMPAVAGWTEEKRRTQLQALRVAFEKHGGRVISERRIRNTAFDERGEKTTTKFVVEWSR